MKLCIVIICLFSCNLVVFGQLPKNYYEKIKFENEMPKWHETLFDSSLVNNHSDGYNSFSISTQIHPIFDGDNMISIRGVLNRDIAYSGGAIIQKRDLNTGKILWSTLYDLHSQPFPEVPFKMYIGNDGFLHVHGFRNRIDAKPDFFPFLYLPTDSCLLTYRKINVHNGDIEEFYTPLDNDQNALLVIASIDKHSRYSNIFSTDDKDIFIYWERRNITLPTIHYTKVDKYGYALTETDSFDISTPTNSSINLLEFNKDTLVHINFNKESQLVKLYYYNKLFQIIDSVQFSNFPGQFRLYTNAEIIDNKYIFINTFDSQLDHYRYLDVVYDLNGNVIDFFEIRSYDFLEYWTSFDQIRKKILILSSKLNQTPLKYVATLYETDDLGGIKKLHDFIPTDSLRTINGFFIYAISQNESLVHFYEGALYQNEFNQIRYDEYAHAHSFMLFEARQLGLGTVSVNDVENQFDLTLYPNPAFDLLTIRIGEIMEGKVSVFDNLGKMVFCENFQNQNFLTLPLNQLLAGMYIVRIQNNQKGVWEKRFVKL